MPTIISKSVDRTRQIGDDWGKSAAPGWFLGLSGNLGAGKTELVKGIAAGLGTTDRVHSPTFALLNQYRGGRSPLFHLDLYRLENVQAILAAGLEEYFDLSSAVVVVEWIERWAAPSLTPATLLAARSHPSRWARLEEISLSERRIIYEDFGT